MPEMPTIGPLTAEEWCEFRLREDDDLLQCCAVTSEMRDAIFLLLRMGAETPSFGRASFCRAWDAMTDHGFPDGRGGELLQKLHDFYLTDRRPA